MSTLVDKVLEVVRRNSPGTTRVQEIMEKVEATAGGVYATLSQMVERGRLARISPGVYGLPTDGHAPPAPPPPAPPPTSLIAQPAPTETARVFGAIERGIPLPPPKRRANELEQLAQAMQPGDSVLLETKNVAQRLCRVGKALGLPMVFRTVDGGVRVWRVADEA